MTAARKPRGAKAPQRTRAVVNDEHDDVLNLRVGDFCRIHSVSRTTTWRLIRAGEIEALRVGRNVFITRESADLWRANCPRVRSVKDAATVEQPS